MCDYTICVGRRFDPEATYNLSLKLFSLIIGVYNKFFKLMRSDTNKTFNDIRQLIHGVRVVGKKITKYEICVILIRSY